jgi:AcrR family transcriptional regulator
MGYYGFFASALTPRYAGLLVETAQRHPSRPAEKTRGRLIDAAEHLLRENGIAGVTTQRVARECGLSEGTIYRHFKNLEELILTTLRLRLAGDFNPHIAALIGRAGKGSVEGNLYQFVLAIAPIFSIVAPALGMLASHPALAARYASSLRADGGGPSLTIERVAEYFAAEKRIGRVSLDIDSRVAANLLTSLCFHRSLIRSLFDEDPILSNDQELASALSTIVGRGVAASTTPPE